MANSKHKLYIFCMYMYKYINKYTPLTKLSKKNTWISFDDSPSDFTTFCVFFLALLMYCCNATTRRQHPTNKKWPAAPIDSRLLLTNTLDILRQSGCKLKDHWSTVHSDTQFFVFVCFWLKGHKTKPERTVSCIFVNSTVSIDRKVKQVSASS